MSNYTKTTDFAAKDSLPSGNSDKIIKGAEFETEFDDIATAIATKADADAATLTGTTSFETLSDGTISVTAFVDEDDMSSNSATLLPTQQSVKAYVDSQVTAQDLDFQGDTGGALSIDLDSETLTVAGGTGIDTAGSANTLTVNIDSTVATLTGTQTLTNKTLTSPDVNTPDIDGGTIDGTVIGGTTAAAGSFTTVSATGNITVGGTVDGRDVATDGTKLDGIEAGADVTDTANVTAAGALMDSEVTNLAQVKAFDSSDYATAAQGTTADSAMQDLVDDTTPQLGGDLDVNGNDIVTTSNGDITLAPNGTGDVVISEAGLASKVAGDNATGAGIRVEKSRGTIASPSAITNGDDIFSLDSRGHDGTSYQTTASIRFDTDGSISTGVVPQKITFSTSATNALGRSDRMTIKSDGKVGIGSTSPSTLLDVNGTVTATGLSVSSITYPTTDGTNGQVLTTDGAGTLSFADAGGGFDSAVDNPAVGNGSSASATNGTAYGHDAVASGNNSTALGFTSNATATGAVALGYLSDATATYAISIGDSDAQATYAIAIGGNAQANAAATYGIAIGYNAKAQAANAIHINSSSSQTNRPTVAGNMVIETNDARLQYKSSKWEFFQGADKRVEFNTNGININASFPAFQMQDSDETNKYGRFTQNNGTFTIDSRNDTLDGPILFRGLGGGTTNEYARFGNNGALIMQLESIRMAGGSGTGMDFSGVGQAARTLDDYEEGTFVPVYQGTTTNPVIDSGDYDIQVGHFTKIGRQVTITLALGTDFVTTQGSGTLRIGGLPFASLSGTAGYFGALGYQSGWTANNTPTNCRMFPGSDKILLQTTTADAPRNSDHTANVNAGSMGTTPNDNRVNITLTYFTA